MPDDGPVQQRSETKVGRITRARERGHRRQSQPRRYAAQWSIVPGSKASDLRPPVYSKVSDAPPEAVDRAYRHKWPWIARFVDLDYPRGQLQACAAEHAEKMGLAAPEIPRYTTLREWARRYKVFGILGLVDAGAKDAGQSRRLSTPERDRIELAVIGGKMTSPAAVTTYLAATDTSAPPKKYHTVRREMQRLESREPHLVSLATQGDLYFRNRHQLAIPQAQTPGGDTLLIDSTVADIWIRIPDANAPDGWSAVRPALSIAEDEGSRMFVTFNLSLTAITSGVILGMFRRAVMTGSNFPGLLSIGVPRAVSVDKGAEHRAEFMKTVKMLGIEVTPRLPRSPQGGARVERLIDTISREVFTSRPGYSPTQKVFDPYAPAHRDTKRSLRQLKYDPYRLEVPVKVLDTYEDLETLILGWATVYNARPHRSLPATDAAIVRVIEAAKRRNAYVSSLEDAS